MSRANHIFDQNQGTRASPWKFLAFLLLFGLPGCNNGGVSAIGPVGYPVCTCCCGEYGPTAYKQTAAQVSSPPAWSAASLFDTKGPLTNVSANRSPLHKRAKGHK
jgi:hypothetical protein